MYFSKTTELGEVYEKPEYLTYNHICELHNGELGPGSSTKLKHLKGILLMGDKNDYRLPAMQLFTAPLYIKEKHHYENVTSIMTIGNGECVAEKGPARAEVICAC